MKKSTIFWLVNLALLLVVELVTIFSIGKMNGPFNSDTITSTYQIQSGSSLVIDPIIGQVTTQDVPAAEQKPKLTGAAAVLLNALVYVLVAVVILGAVAGLGGFKEE